MAAAAKRLEPATHRIAEASAAALLLLERSLLSKLAAVIALYGRIADGQLRAIEDQEAEQIAAQGSRILKTAALDLETAATAAILAARSATRRAAAEQLTKQLVTAEKLLLRAGVPLARGDMAVPVRATPEADAALAATSASSLSNAWIRDSLQRLLGWTREGADGRVPPVGQDAAQAGRYRARRTAATETAQAFNHEVDAILEVIGDRIEQAPVGQLLFKRWEAVLDRVVCGRCANYDNQVVPCNKGFRGGEIPGHVHPNCRCIAVVALHEVDLNVAHAVAREMFGPGLGRVAQGRDNVFEDAHQWTAEERAEWMRRYGKAQNDAGYRTKLLRSEVRRHDASAEAGTETASTIVPRLRSSNVMARDRRSTRQVHDDTGGAFVIREVAVRVKGARDWRAKRDQEVPRGPRLGRK